MSVCRKLPDGTVQKIAGHTILLDANASEIREGNFTLPATSTGQVNSATITFTDPMPDTDYIVVITGNGIASEQDVRTQWHVTNKTVTGFTASYYSQLGASVSYHYYAWKPIKLDGYTALQNKVNNPDEVPTENSENLVTSGGVYEAIKNASAVWKGTKAAWEALPAADKMKYDLAVLIDETLVKAVDREDGTETDVANLNKIWRGTQEEWDALSAAEKAKYDQAEISGNANEGVTYVADVVEEGNMNPVTSDAVFEAFNDVKSGDVILESLAIITAGGFFKYAQTGHVVNVFFHGVVPGGTAPGWFKVGQLPSTIKFPTHDVTFLAKGPSNAADINALIAIFNVSTSGGIHIWHPTQATDVYLAGNVTYIA